MLESKVEWKAIKMAAFKQNSSHGLINTPFSMIDREIDRMIDRSIDR